MWRCVAIKETLQDLHDVTSQKTAFFMETDIQNGNGILFFTILFPELVSTFCFYISTGFPFNKGRLA
jgi:hypothetical protein